MVVLYLKKKEKIVYSRPISMHVDCRINVRRSSFLYILRLTGCSEAFIFHYISFTSPMLLAPFDSPISGLMNPPSVIRHPGRNIWHFINAISRCTTIHSCK